jgi:hypothetical protein
VAENDPRLPTLRAELARATRISRVRPGDPAAADAVANARRAYAAARIEDFARRALADAPPLTDEQRARLGLLLQTGQTEGAA